MRPESSSAGTGPSRRAWRLLGLGLVVAVVLILGIGSLVLANVYMPLTEGSASGPDSAWPGGLYARNEQDPFGTGTMYVYCSVPNARFAVLLSIRNDGPLPVTILGSTPSDLTANEAAGGNQFWLTDLASARVATPTDTPALSHEATDPRTTATMAPTVIAPGDELELWARFRTGGIAMPRGSASWGRSLGVRYSVLGIERTVEVSLRDGFRVEGGCVRAQTGN